jgi:hypothetical protein
VAKALTAAEKAAAEAQKAAVAEALAAAEKRLADATIAAEKARDAAAAAAAATAAAAAAAAAAPVPFDAATHFSGKTIKIITGTSPGGGYDIFSRLVARVAVKHFPPDTRFAVVNAPGGSQLRGNRLVWDAKPDGLVTGPVHPRWFIRSALGEEVEGLDLVNDIMLGSPTASQSSRFICADTRFARKWSDVLQQSDPWLVGHLGPGSSAVIAAALLEIVGAPVKMLYGYEGTSDVMAAFDRGEITGLGVCDDDTVVRLFPEWEAEGRLAPLLWAQLPTTDPGAAPWITRLGYDPASVPNLFDLEGVTFTQAHRDGFAAALAMTTANRVFMLPHDTPVDIANYWRGAFQAIMEDPEFEEIVAVAGYGEDFNYQSGDEIQKALGTAGALDDAGRGVLRQLLGLE